MTDGGQGLTDSSFGFLVFASSGVSTTLDVYRVVPGGVITEKTVVIPGGTSASVFVPWQSIGAGAKFGIGASGIRRYGYRLATDRPVVVHQFNSLSVYQATTTTCTSDSSCNLFNSDQACFDIPTSGKRCVYPAFTQDSSLLLPTHALGTAYVITTLEHGDIVTSTDAGNESMSGVLTVVGTQAATTVTVRASALTGAGPSVAAMNKGQSLSFTLEPYEVLQISSRQLVGPFVECFPNPFGGTGSFCREDNDLSGTVVTADKPIAVFAGSPCALHPFSAAACDHLEEQLAPVSTWGKSFVLQQSAPLRLVDGGFASPGAAAPDHWKVVAGCPASQCPTGTAITLFPVPFATDVLPPNRCLTGSIAGNTCRLASGAVMEFKSKQTFTLTADQPVQLVQFLTGQNATQGGAAQGDPSMMSQAPVEQWLTQADVVVPQQFQNSYLALAWDDSKTASVSVDGVLVAPGSAPGTFKVRTIPVGAGPHSVTTLPRPGQASAVGITVYGYAPFVSYGSVAGQKYTPLTTLVP